MDGSEGGDALREALRDFGRRLDVHDQVVRHDERLKHLATREEMNQGDTRVLETVAISFDRAAASHQQYTRDQVATSQLTVANSLQELKGEIRGVHAAIASLQQQTPEAVARRGFHPAVTYGGGSSVVVSALWIIAYMLGFNPLGQ